MIFNVKNKYQDFWKKIKLICKCLYYQEFIISQQYMIIFFLHQKKKWMTHYSKYFKPHPTAATEWKKMLLRAECNPCKLNTTPILSQVEIFNL